ncbi:MAG: type II toxin-antitoxin system RelE/ParE family toxin [Patescibacteria group bacterium]
MNVKIFDAKVERFISTLDKEIMVRVLRTIDLLQVFGHKFSLPHSKKVSKHLFELRVRGQQEIRIFYAFYGGEAVLLHGFIKKSQRLPQKEMKVAEKKYRLLERR